MGKKITSVICAILIVLVLAAAGVGIYMMVGNINKETEKNEGATGFTVEYQDKELSSSAGGVLFTTSETFKVVHTGADSEIFAKVKGKKLPEDYTFSMTKTVDGATQTDTYRWNSDMQEDLTKYFDVTINQDTDTVTVKGTIKELLTSYAARRSATLNTLSALPNVDMFVLEITAGDHTMAIGFHVYAPVYSVSLPELSFC